MLPSDAWAQWLAAVSANAEQGTLNDHVQEVALTECMVPYSHKLFHEAAVAPFYTFHLTAINFILSLQTLLVTKTSLSLYQIMLSAFWTI